MTLTMDPAEKYRKLYEFCKAEGLEIWAGANGGVVIEFGQESVCVDYLGPVGFRTCGVSVETDRWAKAQLMDAGVPRDDH